jgi:DsbC/DsbD-like thiol-disulfide interchange protein
MRLSALTAALVLVLGLGAACAGNAELVKATLLADVSAIRPGEAFHIGVLLEIQPAWHVYWINPGDSGSATKVEIEAPAGFVVGEVKYPFPVKFTGAGDIVGYGYHDEVMLMAEVTPPKDLAAGKDITIRAKASWLVCKDLCLPGKQDLTLSLPVAAKAEAANEAIFAKWKKQLPAPISDSVAKVAGRASPDGGFEEQITFAAAPADVQWFPAPPERSAMENLQTSGEGNVSRLSFHLVPLPKTAGDMLFVVTYKDQSGERQGVEFSVKLPLAAGGP